MRLMTTLALSMALAAPAMMQSAMAQTDGAPAAHRTTRHHSTATRHRGAAPQRETLEDKGPFTPEANRAYNGGGAILEGAPGGPPPPASAVLSMPQGQPLPPAR